jgi:uncharacterized protein
MTTSGRDCIVDADCHISSRKFDGMAILADELVDIMDKAGVDKSLVWLKPPYDKNIDPENRAIFDGVRRHPDRFLGFGWTNPRLGQGRARDIVKQCYEEYGFLGIKFNGAQDDYVIDDDAVLPVIETAVGYGRPIAFHIGGDFPENTHPYRLGRIAARFPEQTFILIHIGGASFPALDRAAIETLERHPNIVTIGSAIHERAILQAIRTIGHERVCFGSDMPFFLMGPRLALYRELLRDEPAEVRRAILGGNILRILGLQEAPAARPAAARA